MASAMPDLWLPSQSRGITALSLVPIYTACWQRHMCEQLAQSAGSWTRDPKSQVKCPNHYITSPPYRRHHRLQTDAAFSIFHEKECHFQYNAYVYICSGNAVII